MTGAHTLATNYDVYEVAYLAGGPRRAVDTAVVALLERGSIRVIPPSGELSVVDPTRRHAAETAVLDAVKVSEYPTIINVRWLIETDERIRFLEQRLERDGLLRPGVVGSTVRRHWWALGLTATGRRTLRSLRSNLPADLIGEATSAMLVALSGPRRMPNRELRTAVFQPPRPRGHTDPFSARYSWLSVGGIGGIGGGIGGDFGGSGGNGGC